MNAPFEVAEEFGCGRVKLSAAATLFSACVRQGFCCWNLEVATQDLVGKHGCHSMSHLQIKLDMSGVYILFHLLQMMVCIICWVCMVPLVPDGCIFNRVRVRTTHTFLPFGILL